VSVLLGGSAAAQTAKFPLALITRSEARADRDATATALFESVRKGLESLPDVEIVPSDGARRIVWIISGTTPGQYAASLMVTERYDRETLMVLGIEDDDMAFRMMALQIVADHQIFTGKTHRHRDRQGRPGSAAQASTEAGLIGVCCAA
jgi:hypothetical protein